MFEHYFCSAGRTGDGLLRLNSKNNDKLSKNWFVSPAILLAFVVGQLAKMQLFTCFQNFRRYHACLDYIHYNPGKRGLVRKPEEWAWSSIRAYGGASPLKLTIDRIRLPTDLDARPH
jgi:hypothetical protein